MERGTDEGQGVLRRDPEQSERAPAPRPATDRAAMPAATANEQLMHAAIHFSARRPPGSPPICCARLKCPPACPISQDEA